MEFISFFLPLIFLLLFIYWLFRQLMKIDKNDTPKNNKKFSVEESEIQEENDNLYDELRSYGFLPHLIEEAISTSVLAENFRDISFIIYSKNKLEIEESKEAISLNMRDLFIHMGALKRQIMVTLIARTQTIESKKKCKAVLNFCTNNHGSYLSNRDVENKLEDAKDYVKSNLDKGVYFLDHPIFTKLISGKGFFSSEDSLDIFNILIEHKFFDNSNIRISKTSLPTKYLNRSELLKWFTEDFLRKTCASVTV